MLNTQAKPWEQYAIGNPPIDYSRRKPFSHYKVLPPELRIETSPRPFSGIENLFEKEEIYHCTKAAPAYQYPHDAYHYGTWVHSDAYLLGTTQDCMYWENEEDFDRFVDVFHCPNCTATFGQPSDKWKILIDDEK